MSNELQIFENLRANHLKLLDGQPDLAVKVNAQYDLVMAKLNGTVKCKVIFYDKLYRCEACGGPVSLFAKFCEHCARELDWNIKYV